MFSRKKLIAGVLSLIIVVVNVTEADWKEDAQAIDISGGEDHTLVLAKNQSVWACGPNGGYTFGYHYYGVLGTGSEDWDLKQKTLVRVHDGAMGTESERLENINDVDAGWLHSLALEKYDPCDPNFMGYVWSWGWNSEGQLGDSWQITRTTPVQVLRGEQTSADPNNPDPNLARIVDISAGRSGEHSLAVDANGYAYA